RREARLEPTLPAIYWARRYGMSAEAIRKVLRYETWGWVPDDEGSMTPSKDGALYIQQVEQRMQERIPEPLSEESTKALGERLLAEQERVKKAKEQADTALSPESVERMVGYGQMTREEADRILAAREKKS